MNVYLDNNATTPLDPKVLEKMQQTLELVPRNPSSITRYGREAKQQLVSARAKIAECCGMQPGEIVFTSGATEANNTLIHSFSNRYPQGAIVASKLDHPSILQPLEHSPRRTYLLGSNETGVPSYSELQRLLETKEIAFVILMGANNETGVKLPLEAFSDLCDFYRVPLILDMVAWMGKEPLELPPGVAAASFSGHKFHGPKGAGFFWCKTPHLLTPLIRGGSQEHGHRGGTENLLGIVGMAEAVSLLPTTNFPYIKELRDQFELALLTALPQLAVNGTGNRISNTSNLYFPNLSAESLLIELDQKGVMASVGSACQANAIEPSHVLLNMGHSYERASASVRFSFSRENALEELDQAVSCVLAACCTGSLP